MKERSTLGTLGTLGFGMAILVLGGCVPEVSLAPAPDTSELAVGESRDVTLRFLRLDVRDFKKTMDAADLRALPRKTLEETWLLDLEARPLVENALEKFTRTPPEEVARMPRAAQNMFYLLVMTPENARLEGTKLGALAGVGEAVGISPSRILADLAGVAPNERIAKTDVVARVVLDQVVATHPNAKTRRGPVTPAHPEGLYPVESGALSVSLLDVATDFADLASRFGPAPLDPADPSGPKHPGFLQSASGLVAAGKSFRMSVRLSANALPYKGIDASRAAVASVGSLGGQVEHAFDFSDPTWLGLEGLEQDLKIGEMVMTVDEDPRYFEGGKGRDPKPTGNSPVWSSPPWVTEHVLAETGRRLAASIPPHCTSYGPSGEVSPPFQAVRVCFDATGFVTMDVSPSVLLAEPPPAPAYFWDLLLEVAEARMHDGGLSEGEANVSMPVHDVPVGVKTDDVVSRIRKNFESDPTTLRAMAEALTGGTRGDADFFYVQPDGETSDFLYFVAPEDIRKDAEGAPARPYGYKNPGFFSDPALTQKVSSQEPVAGDTTHEKVKVSPGQTLYIEDDEGRVFEILVSGKPSLFRLSLVVLRVS